MLTELLARVLGQIRIYYYYYYYYYWMSSLKILNSTIPPNLVFTQGIALCIGATLLYLLSNMLYFFESANSENCWMKFPELFNAAQLTIEQLCSFEDTRIHCSTVSGSPQS